LTVVARASVIMGRMARRGCAVAGLAAVVLLTACTPGEESRPAPQGGPQNAALTVATVDPGRLDDETRAEMESEISDVLAGYVVAGFLGDYPRDDFVDGFADFTGGATEDAVRDIDALTVAGIKEVASVRATRLHSRLSFLVEGRRVVGASAWVDFAFEVEGDGATTRETLRGRLVLQLEDSEWAVFGYDLRRGGGGGTVSAESSP
jgi:hypothetical protein